MPGPNLLAASVALIAYAAAGLLAWRQQPSLRWVALIALVLHASSLSMQLIHSGTLQIGVTEALSLFAWQSASLFWAFCWREPLSINGIVIYPVAGAFALWGACFPSPLSAIEPLHWKIGLHVLISLLAAGVLTLAAVQASALAVQDRLLHRHAVASLHRLPPLQLMERLFFQMVAIGFGLLSATLLTGFWFIDDWLAQHLAHKTVLSMVAWLVFGVLLWGRWRYGWRGRIAVRWALSGYGILLLAYFGSKLVLEIILQKHWAAPGS